MLFMVLKEGCNQGKEKNLYTDLYLRFVEEVMH